MEQLGIASASIAEPSPQRSRVCDYVVAPFKDLPKAIWVDLGAFVACGPAALRSSSNDHPRMFLGFLATAHHASRYDSQNTGDHTLGGPLFALIELTDNIIKIHTALSLRLRPTWRFIATQVQRKRKGSIALKNPRVLPNFGLVLAHPFNFLPRARFNSDALIAPKSLKLGHWRLSVYNPNANAELSVKAFARRT
jgi:hypothetical protein